MKMELSDPRIPCPEFRLMRRRPVKPCVGASYFALIAGCHAAMAAGLSMFAKTTAGSLESMSAWGRIEAQAPLPRAFLFMATLAFISIMIDFTGRFGASMVFDLRRIERVSVRRWARCRFAVLAAVLLALRICACIAPGLFPHPQGWMAAAFLAALLAPPCLAAVEWSRAGGDGAAF